MNKAEDSAKRHSFDPASRGYHVVYREREINHCPGCGRTQWWLGRMSAECGFCATTLPFAEAHMGGGLHVRCGTGPGPVEPVY